jgi:hypothetical protein
MMTKKGRFVFMGAMVKGLHGWKVDFVGDTEQNITSLLFSSPAKFRVRYLTISLIII